MDDGVLEVVFPERRAGRRVTIAGWRVTRDVLRGCGILRALSKSQPIDAFVVALLSGLAMSGVMRSIAAVHR